MPDWTNAADYPFVAPPTLKNKHDLAAGTAITSLTEWAWEFLRRNPKYREDYAHFRERIRELKKKYGPGWKQADEASVYMPPRLPNEASPKGGGWLPAPGEAAWMLRCEEAGEKPRKISLERWHAEKWGLVDRMGDPGENHGPHIRFARPSWPRRIETFEAAQALFCDQDVDEGKSEEHLIEPGKALIAFDLRHAIGPQIKKARALVAGAKTAKGIKALQSLHKHKGPWVKYLRVLDGLEADAPLAKIAKTLGAAVTQAYDWQRAAERLRDVEYRYIGSE